MTTLVIIFALLWAIVIACCLILAGQQDLEPEEPEPQDFFLDREHNIVYVGHARDGTTHYKCTCGCGWTGER